LLLRILTIMHSIVLLLHIALFTVISGRPAVDDFEHIPGIPEARLLDWTKFLFAEDGIVTSLTNIAKNPTSVSFLSSADRNSKRKFGGNFDLNSLFKNFGINLQPQNSGIFDFFDMFDLSKMGLCNRETCGDLYKLFDKIRSSDFVLNLKTLFALLKDEEGLDLLKAMLANPEMLKTFMGGAGDGDKPEIAFVVDKNGKPIANDYDDYYFDGSVGPKPQPNIQQDDTLTITRPHQDVAIPYAINATSDEQDEFLETITTNSTSTITTTTAQENNGDKPPKIRQPADYYAFYYDAEPEIQKDDNTIKRAEIVQIDDLSTGQLNITSTLDDGLSDVEKVLQNTTTAVV
ncbi:hypothetical protein T02_5908, partial [Trichinella nativa]